MSAYQKKLHSYEIGRGYLFFTNNGRSAQLREITPAKLAWSLPKKFDRLVIGGRVKLVAMTLPARRAKKVVRRYENADPGTCGIYFNWKERATETVCGRKPGHKGEHSWYHDCGQCKGVMGEHESNCYLTHPVGPKEKKR